MTIRSRATRPTVGKPADPSYEQAFVSHVHQLIAAGYAQLDRSCLAKKTEEAITGLLVAAVVEFIENPGAPDWAVRYEIHEDPPVAEVGREGRCRRRVDIQFRLVTRGKRPRFCFEAKRLYRADSVRQYVGAEGLGRFLAGHYSADEPAAGMLGYVQKESPTYWSAQIRTTFEHNRASFGLPAAGDCLQPMKFHEILGTTVRSQHDRVRNSITLYHTLLPCHVKRCAG